MPPSKLPTLPSTRIKLRSTAQNAHIAATPGMSSIGMPTHASNGAGSSLAAPVLLAYEVGLDSSTDSAAMAADDATAADGKFAVTDERSSATGMLPITETDPITPKGSAPLFSVLHPLQLAFRDAFTTPVHPQRAGRRLTQGSAPCTEGPGSSPNPASRAVSTNSPWTAPTVIKTPSNSSCHDENDARFARYRSAGYAGSHSQTPTHARHGLKPITNQAFFSCPPLQRTHSSRPAHEEAPAVRMMGPLWNLPGVMEDRWLF